MVSKGNARFRRWWSYRKRTRHGFTPREVFAFHVTLGEARRNTMRQHREMVDVAIAAETSNKRDALAYRGEGYPGGL